MKLTKTTIVEKLKPHFPLVPQGDLEDVVDHFFHNYCNRLLHLPQEIRLPWPGLGYFQRKFKKARVGRNPASGEPMEIAPRWVLTFKCNPKAREKLNTSESEGVEDAQ